MANRQPKKGDLLSIGGMECLVIDEADGLFRLMPRGVEKSARWYARGSLVKATFHTAEGDREGPKYAGSDLDVANRSFIDSLTSDVASAIVERQCRQYMFRSERGPMAEGDDYGVSVGPMGGNAFGIRMLSTQPLSIGARRIVNASLMDVFSYYEKDEVTTDEVAWFAFGDVSHPYDFSWFSDAADLGDDSAMGSCSDNGRIDGDACFGSCLILPTFWIGLDGIEYGFVE